MITQNTKYSKTKKNKQNSFIQGNSFGVLLWDSTPKSQSNYHILIYVLKDENN